MLLAVTLVVLIVNINSQSHVSSVKFPVDSDKPPVTVTDDGGFTFGSSLEVNSHNDAPVMDIYYDYQCPGCKIFEQINMNDLLQLASDGVITLEYHPVSILDRASGDKEYSTRAANAAATILKFAPSVFNDFHQALFDNQPEENSDFDPVALLENIAHDSGVPSSVISKFEDGLFTRWVSESTDKARANGLAQTPTIIFNGSPLPDNVNWAAPGELKKFVQQEIN